ncbi:MAG: hypothetical protein CMJ58_07585 [Planctomycetaceae bacterium]|nr:hypothetical protein [Planctomycetaceae bacterium]
MWLTLGITLVVVALALLGMAIGVIISGRCIKGSCGGLANLRDSQGRSMCEACTNPSPECRGERAEQPSEDALEETTI